MKKNKEDAVSSVVAIMLILAVAVVCIAVLSSSYVPQLKENSEMMHSDEVKDAFLKFSDDVNRVYSNAQTGELTTSLSLGGGDIMISPSMSSGTLEVRSVTLGDVIIKDGNETDIKRFTLSTVNVTYTPIMPYWEDQGYFYEKGLVWVTKNNVKVPYRSDLYSAADGSKYEDEVEESWFNSMKNSICVNEKWNFNGTGDNRQFVHLSDDVSIDIVNLTVDPQYNYISGSADAVIRISSQKTKETVIIPMNSTIMYEDNLWYAAQYETTLTINRINAVVKVV